MGKPLATAAPTALPMRPARQKILSDARRQHVLDAARAVFLQLGLEGTSVREIAQRAGYTPGAIYSYFASKEEVYAALLSESMERLTDAMLEATKSTRITSARRLAMPDGKSQFAHLPHALEQKEHLRLEGVARHVGIEALEIRVLVGTLEHELGTQASRQAARERRLAHADRPFDRDVTKALEPGCFGLRHQLRKMKYTAPIRHKPAHRKSSLKGSFM